MKSVFIETNSYSRYSKGDRKIKDLLSKSNIVYISVVSLGELYYGFKKGDREGRNIGLLKSFLDDLRVKVVNVTIDTSRFYSTIKYQLVRSGTPIPENDIWIAAQIIETGSELITYDRHFLDVKGLKVWKKLSGKN